MSWRGQFRRRPSLQDAWRREREPQRIARLPSQSSHNPFDEREEEDPEVPETSRGMVGEAVHMDGEWIASSGDSSGQVKVGWKEEREEALEEEIPELIASLRGRLQESGGAINSTPLGERDEAEDDTWKGVYCGWRGEGGAGDVLSVQQQCFDRDLERIDKEDEEVELESDLAGSNARWEVEGEEDWSGVADVDYESEGRLYMRMPGDDCAEEVWDDAERSVFPEDEGEMHCSILHRILRENDEVQGLEALEDIGRRRDNEVERLGPPAQLGCGQGTEDSALCAFDYYAAVGGDDDEEEVEVVRSEESGSLGVNEDSDGGEVDAEHSLRFMHAQMAAPLSRHHPFVQWSSSNPRLAGPFERLTEARRSLQFTHFSRNLPGHVEDRHGIETRGFTPLTPESCDHHFRSSSDGGSRDWNCSRFVWLECVHGVEPSEETKEMLRDEEFLLPLLQSLPGVDPQDSELQFVVQMLQGYLDVEECWEEYEP